MFPSQNLHGPTDCHSIYDSDVSPCGPSFDLLGVDLEMLVEYLYCPSLVVPNGYDACLKNPLAAQS